MASHRVDKAAGVAAPMPDACRAAWFIFSAHKGAAVAGSSHGLASFVNSQMSQP